MFTTALLTIVSDTGTIYLFVCLPCMAGGRGGIVSIMLCSSANALPSTPVLGRNIHTRGGISSLSTQSLIEVAW